MYVFENMQAANDWFYAEVFRKQREHGPKSCYVRFRGGVRRVTYNPGSCLVHGPFFPTAQEAR